MGAITGGRTDPRPSEDADEILEGLIAEFLRVSREAGVGEAAVSLLVKFARRAAKNPDSGYRIVLASSHFAVEGVRLFEYLRFKITFICTSEELDGMWAEKRLPDDEEAYATSAPSPRELFVVPEEVMLEINRLAKTDDVLCILSGP